MNINVMSKKINLTATKLNKKLFSTAFLEKSFENLSAEHIETVKLR